MDRRQVRALIEEIEYAAEALAEAPYEKEARYWQDRLRRAVRKLPDRDVLRLIGRTAGAAREAAWQAMEARGWQPQCLAFYL